MNKTAVTVSELNRYIKEIIEGDTGLRNVFVKGEISNYKFHSSGHMYFTLKDENSKIKCIMFRTYNSALKFIPEDGMNVIVRGSISIYERDGQYQLYCNKMEPDGIGSLYLAYEQLKEKLQREGLFDEAIKKKIPFFSEKIGIATSSTGAVIRDIINVSVKRFKNVNLLLYPVKVQGDGAAESIIEAIDYFNRRSDIDLIIIGRGGGSIEELWAFNNERLARSIRASKVPIISAVGHETDFTIADFAADMRASTPSHAAELAVPSYEELKYKINITSNNMLRNLKNNLNYRKHFIENNHNIVHRYSPLSIVNQRMQLIDNLQNKISYIMKKELSENTNKFMILLNRIDDLSPVKVLKRGYGYIEESGRVIGNIRSLRIEDKIKVHMHDGYAECNINNIVEDELWLSKKGN